MKSKIQLTDTPVTALAKMCDGNPGAMNALLKIVEESEKIDPDTPSFMGLHYVLLLDTWRIYGTDIYILYSDNCGRDMEKMIGLLRGCQLGFLPESILQQACSRQDYSGKDMIDIDGVLSKVKERLPNFGKKAA